MTERLTLSTDRLRLVSADVDHLDAELLSRHALGTLLEADVPESWPPGAHDQDAVAFFRAQLIAEGEPARGWFAWYAIERGARDVLVASIGYLGPPSTDRVVEIGYSVVPERRGRGFASEMVRAIVDRAFVLDVRTVVAETSDGNTASRHVLVRCGFAESGGGREPRALRYVYTRDAWEKSRAQAQ